MSNTINNGIPFVPENTIDPAAGLNEALLIIDRLLQLRVLLMKENTPPSSPTVGNRYIVGASPTGAWSGKALLVAEWMEDEYWAFSPASVAVYGTSVYLNTGTDWVPATAGGGTAWGGITGTLADQEDLAEALSEKVNENELAAVASSGAANDVSIEDDGEYFGSETVEGVLQEVGAMIGDISTALDEINGESI